MSNNDDSKLPADALPKTLINQAAGLVSADGANYFDGQIKKLDKERPDLSSTDLQKLMEQLGHDLINASDKIASSNPGGGADSFIYQRPSTKLKEE